MDRNQMNENEMNVLEKYGTELVEKARSQKIDPVIGRDEEIRSVIRILSRTTKNCDRRRTCHSDYERGRSRFA